MLAPLRDYLSPKDPGASPLLCATKEHYFSRMSVIVGPTEPSFGESQWITSEDINVENLLDVFVTIDASDAFWSACVVFTQYLFFYKKRLTALKPNIEGLPDDHFLKPYGLLLLSQLFGSVGNQVERKQLLVRALGLWREQGSDSQVGLVLTVLSEINWVTGLLKEGVLQTREALGIYGRLGDTEKQALYLSERTGAA